jgi:hypothetical protein
MDSFVEAQNRLKRMSYRGAITLFKNAAKPRSSLLVHTCGREVTGLKTYRGPKRKDQLGVQHGRGSGVAVPLFEGVAGLEGSRYAPSSFTLFGLF